MNVYDLKIHFSHTKNSIVIEYTMAFITSEYYRFE